MDWISLIPCHCLSANKCLTKNHVCMVCLVLYLQCYQKEMQEKSYAQQIKNYFNYYLNGGSEILVTDQKLQLLLYGMTTRPTIKREPPPPGYWQILKAKIGLYCRQKRANRNIIRTQNNQQFKLNQYWKQMLEKEE